MIDHDPRKVMVRAAPTYMSNGLLKIRVRTYFASGLRLVLGAKRKENGPMHRTVAFVTDVDGMESDAKLTDGLDTTYSSEKLILSS
jgi:hypothetical protein